MTKHIPYPNACYLTIALLFAVTPFLKAQNLLTKSAKDSMQVVNTTDINMEQLLHSDTAKFNYQGTEMLLIDMRQARTHSKDDKAKLNKKNDSTALLNHIDKPAAAQNNVNPNNKKLNIPTISKLKNSNTALSTPTKKENKQTNKLKHRSRAITPLEPIERISVALDNTKHSFVVQKMTTIKMSQKKAANVMNYEASPALDIIGKNKIVQRPIVKYEKGTNDNSEAMYRARLAALQTIVPMTYNALVHDFIDMYVNQKRDQVGRMLPRTDRYFTTFEETLDRYGLPMELKYLPVMESALIPHAKSQTGASGLWQLPYSVAKDYGLSSNNFIDERRDPKLSTEVAVMYLKNLYRKYLNWHLVIAAYHCGNGEMDKAIQKAGGIRDYWELATFLPIETQAYVPLFIAATYTMNYYTDHHIEKFDAPYTYYSIDTIKIKKDASLQDIAKQIDMNIAELQYLNPAIIHDYIPASTKGYPLTLPVSKVGALSAYLNNLKNQKEIILDRTQEKNIELPAGNMWQYNTDVFGNRTSSSEMRGVVAGEITANNDNSYITKNPTNNPSNRHKTVNNEVIIAHYAIQKGDNMKQILQKFPGLTADDIIRVNNLKNGKLIRGSTLKIPLTKRM